MIKDRQAARESAMKILDYPFERIVVAYNAVVENDAHDAARKAFSSLGI